MNAKHVIESISYADGRIVCSCGAVVEASRDDDFAWRDHRRGRVRKRAGRRPVQREAVAPRPRPEAGPRWSPVSPNYRPPTGPEGRKEDGFERAFFCDPCDRWHPIIWRHIGLSLHGGAPVDITDVQCKRQAHRYDRIGTTDMLRCRRCGLERAG